MAAMPCCDHCLSGRAGAAAVAWSLPVIRLSVRL